MIGKPGDRIIVEAMRAGQEPRRGQILEAIQGEAGVRYQVRWSDGHESLFTPAAGTARIEPAAESSVA